MRSYTVLLGKGACAGMGALTWCGILVSTTGVIYSQPGGWRGRNHLSKVLEEEVRLRAVGL